MKPFLRWAGSKRQLLPKLAEYWDNNESKYIEPFVGSGALFFHLEPSSAILGDLNQNLMTMYSQLRDNLEEVLDYLEEFGTGENEYYRARALNPMELQPAKRAARFIYLNRNAFNGLYRTNRKGEFNVPFGGYKSGSLPTRNQFVEYSRKLKRCQLRSGDFEDTLSMAKSGDFVYMDPPYSVRIRRVFTDYDAESFSNRDLPRLRNALEELSNRNVKFLVSYADSREGRLLANGYQLRYVYVRRNVAGFSSNRRKARELLISNHHMFPKN